MTQLITSLVKESPSFQANVEAMEKQVAEFRMYEARVRANSERKREKFIKRGQLMPVDRVSVLLDKGSPFLEISTLAGLHMHDDDGKKNAAGGGSIAGIGYVSGKRCMVLATDSAIKGGSVSPMGLKKSLRLQEIALKQKLPIINLAESAGANLKYQSELFVEGGRNFANQARLSAAGIPQITVVHGSSTAGGAYLPGLSDYTVVIRGRTKIFLAGPPLLKAATGEIATDEDLGGASMHFEKVGTAEYMGEDDAHGIEIARDIVGSIPWSAPKELPEKCDPIYSVEELMGVVPDDSKKPYDVREIIMRITDHSKFLEFKASFGASTVCGHGAINGQRLGILGNNGPITADGAVKAAQFIQLCSQSNTPLLFLMNTTGFMVGSEAESSGMVKHGSKMIQAVANTQVPKITIVIGGAWGAGYYGMCGRGFDPDFIFSWPTARIGVMGPEQAATVMKIITEQKFSAMGQDVPEEAIEAMKQSLLKQMEPETTALFGTARLWDDGIIDPRDTRKVVSLALSVCEDGRSRQVQTNSFGIARG
ncbi:acyl-CoA carboxylase subunit beta [Flexibacterium corallicola]|uniref:acyl-CoA carboxylase subunit beta n=1 Tax=Flexibacterium corallicola TaxID=3037259 RepID=UPI00286EF1E3|nr:carboxyl transferase domain-containing protein [Pseudovibrio sp. M1P-2-3]